jgi:hypothetical protein
MERSPFEEQDGRWRIQGVIGLYTRKVGEQKGGNYFDRNIAVIPAQQESSGKTLWLWMQACAGMTACQF